MYAWKEWKEWEEGKIVLVFSEHDEFVNGVEEVWGCQGAARGWEGSFFRTKVFGGGSDTILPNDGHSFTVDPSGHVWAAPEAMTPV